MSTRYSAERNTIGNLLSMTNPPIVVPDWQRNYSWTAKEVETFWLDLKLFDSRYPDDNINAQEYFLGSVVLVDSVTSSLLLDGQQRLATSAILLSVIRDFLVRYNKDSAVRLSAKYLTDYDDAAERNVFKLTMNKFDRDFFRREILEFRTAEFQAPRPMMESHNLIRAARDYFVSIFEKESAERGEPLASHRWALRVQKVLTQHVSVVAVVSEDEDNAANVFETLNDRGIGLSTPDLLRNLLIRRAPEEARVEMIDLWEEILQTEGDVKLKTFLRHFWISSEGDVKTQGLYREMKKKIVDENTQSLPFSRKLKDSSIVYRDILAGQDDDQDMAAVLGDITNLGAQLLYPIILSGYEVLTDKTDLLRLLRLILVVYVRHSLIGKLENSLLETLAFNQARVLRVNQDTAAAIAEFKAFAPNDETFKTAFQTVSIPDPTVARYILRQLEAERRLTEELEVSTPARVHIEHIYPQNPPADRKWPNHSQVINRLGNLTLLSKRINVAIKNRDFIEKKPSYEQSEILMTRDLLARNDWNPEAIEERQVALSQRAAQIWPLD